MNVTFPDDNYWPILHDTGENTPDNTCTIFNQYFIDFHLIVFAKLGPALYFHIHLRYFYATSD